MFKKLATIAVTAMLTLYAGSSFAAFGNMDLVRVVFNQTGGITEIATNLGNIDTLLASGGTFGGDASAFTAQTGGNDFANLHVVYFAFDNTLTPTRSLWITGQDASISPGKATILQSLQTGLFDYYNILPFTGTTVAADASWSSSYRVLADSTTQFGQFGTAIVAADRPFTEASLAPLGSSGPVTQNLYYFANYAVAGNGVAVASITTHPNGTTTIGPPVDQAAPTVTITTPPPTTSTSATVNITFTATDTIGVTAYQLNESPTAPTAGAAGWVAITPSPSFNLSTAHTFNDIVPGVPTLKTLYVWAKDAAGNVSAQKFSSTTITIPAGDAIPPAVTIDTPAPLTATSATVSVAFTATDATGVTGYLLNESATPPTDLTTGWTSITPSTTFSGNAGYTFPSVEPGVSSVRTVHVWARDAAGNVSPAASIATTIRKPVQVPAIVAPQDPYFLLLQDALNAVPTGSAILTMSTTIAETPLTYNRTGITATLKGGYDTGYPEPPLGMTTIQGTLAIMDGTLNVQGVTIRQP